MSNEVPEGIRAMYRTWGRQKRRILSGAGDWYVDCKGLRKTHIDGYAASFMGKLMEERDGCGQGSIRQYWPEVMWGDGLEVQRNLPGMPERPFYAFHLVHAFDPEFGLTMQRKAALLEMKLTPFKEAVGHAEWWLWGRLEPQGRSASQVTALIEKIIHKRLQTPTHGDIKAQTERVGPQLDYAALNRPTLKLHKRPA